MKPKDCPPADDYQIRCPRLGHQIFFSYCRSENAGNPCFKTLDCWHPHFNVADYLQSKLTPEQWQALISRNVRPKVVSLVELIQNARRSEKE